MDARLVVDTLAFSLLVHICLVGGLTYFVVSF
jgi:hypothetical protein